MSPSTELSDAILHIFANPADGVQGIVDNLVCLCQTHHVQLDFEPPRYRAKVASGAWQELGDLKIKKSVIRAIVARLATLCTSDSPGSVSPYGGSGVVSVSRKTKSRCLVDFKNTASEQSLRLQVLESPNETPVPINGSLPSANPSDAAAAS